MARTPEERRTFAMTAIEAIGEGEFLTSISKRLDVPYSSLVRWIDDDEELAGMYSRARIQGYMKRMEDIEDDAQKLVDDVKCGAIADPAPTIAAFKELRCIRQWNAGKFAKGLFGEKTQIEHSGSIETLAPISPEQAIAAAQEAEQAGEV